MKHTSGLCLTLGLLLTLGSCGGGNSTAGIEGTGDTIYASGSVTSFGSVYVNGERFITGNASININGESAAESDLGAGMVVEITGITQNGAGELVAQTLSYERNLLGEVTDIETIDTDTKVLTVLGQTLTITSDLVFENTEFEALAVSDLLDISGLFSDAGILQPTRIEKIAATDILEVEGKITNLQSEASTFMLQALIVDYSQVSFTNGALDQLANDITVKLQGTLAQDGSFVATQVRFKTNTQTLPANTLIFIEGIIENFSSVTSFDVAGHSVNTGNAEIERGSVNQLQNGVRISLQGRVNAAGIVHANLIRLQLASQSKVRGSIENINPQTGEFTVLGTTFSSDQLTAFEDRSSQGNRFINFNQLAVGDYVEVFGRLVDGEWIALRIKRLNDDGAVTLSGSVSNIESDTLFYVMGVQVDASAAEGVELVGSFTPGTKVIVEGTQTGAGAVMATRISLAI
jgi:hypothetical protein